MSFYGQIYKITYPNDPHYYYGQTVQNPERRLRQHINAAFRGSNTDFSYFIRSLSDPYTLTIQTIKLANSRDDLTYRESLYVNPNLDDPLCLNMYPAGGTYSGEDHHSTLYPDWMILRVEANDSSMDKLLEEFSDFGYFPSRGWIIKVRAGILRNSPNYIPPPKNDQRGENNACSLITWQDVYYIRKHCREYSQANLKRYLDPIYPVEIHYEGSIKYTTDGSISQANLSHIIHNKRWYDENWDENQRSYMGIPESYQEYWDQEDYL